MKHALHCKFCKKPITVEIDDAYAELGDPMKLLPMACCNPCADLRVKRRNIEENIKAVAMILVQCKGKVPQAISQMASEQLRVKTQAYCKLIAEWHDMSGMAWDENIPAAIMDHPDMWYSVLERLWKIFKEDVLPESIKRQQERNSYA